MQSEAAELRVGVQPDVVPTRRAGLRAVGGVLGRRRLHRRHAVHQRRLRTAAGHTRAARALYTASHHTLGHSPGQWVIWVIFHVRVTEVVISQIRISDITNLNC